MTGITETLTIALISVGIFFLTAGTLGLLRLPDVYNRMHATTKATTLGTASIFLAAFLSFGAGAGLTALIGIFFLFLTAPTGAHLISRAAHTMGVEFAGEANWPTSNEKQSIKKEIRQKRLDKPKTN